MFNIDFIRSVRFVLVASSLAVGVVACGSAPAGEAQASSEEDLAGTGALGAQCGGTYGEYGTCATGLACVGATRANVIGHCAPRAQKGHGELCHGVYKGCPPPLSCYLEVADLVGTCVSPGEQGGVCIGGQICNPGLRCNHAPPPVTLDWCS